MRTTARPPAKSSWTSKFGVPTAQDILKELEKPGRDPRPAFKTATFQEDVETMRISRRAWC